MRQLLTPDGEKIIIRAILATDQHYALGYDNDLIFHNKDDLARFKSKTLHCVCIMGRKTYESIGRILPKRQTVVVTHDIEKVNNIIDNQKLPDDTPRPIVTSTVISDLPKIVQNYGNPKIWVCGGAAIYEMFKNMTSTWLLTQYHIDVVKDHDKYHILPDGFDPDKIIRFDMNAAPLNKFFTDSGEFNGIKYGVYACTRYGIVNNAGSPLDLSSAYDPDAMFYDYLYDKTKHSRSSIHYT